MPADTVNRISFTQSIGHKPDESRICVYVSLPGLVYCWQFCDSVVGYTQQFGTIRVTPGATRTSANVVVTPDRINCRQCQQCHQPCLSLDDCFLHRSFPGDNISVQTPYSSDHSLVQTVLVSDHSLVQTPCGSESSDHSWLQTVLGSDHSLVQI